MWCNYPCLWKARLLHQGSAGLIINNYENSTYNIILSWEIILIVYKGVSLAENTYEVLKIYIIDINICTITVICILNYEL